MKEPVLRGQGCPKTACTPEGAVVGGRLSVSGRNRIPPPADCGRNEGSPESDAEGEREIKRDCETCEIYEVHHKTVEQLKREYLSDEVTRLLSETFKVLGDPTRVRIIHLLSRRRLCVCDISELLNLSTSAVSHQLRILRNLHLVEYEKEGKNVFYTLNDQHIMNIFREGLKHVLHTERE